MFSRVRQAFLSILCALLLTGAVRADTVSLANGDRITGVVRQLAGGKLSIATDYAGEIKINWTIIADLTTDSEVFVKLTDGAEVSGTITGIQSRQMQLVDASNNVLAIELAQIGSLISVEERARELKAAQAARQTPAQVPSRQKRRAPFRLGFLADWVGGIDFGFSLTRGNSNTGQFTLVLASQKKFGHNKIVFNANTLYGVQNGIQSRNSARADLRYDYSISNKGFIYVTTEAETNRPKRLRLRNAYGGGFGWQVIKSDRLNLSTFGGLGTIKQIFSNAPSTLAMEGRVGQEINFSPSEKTKISQKYELLPNFTQRGNYRSQLDVGLQTPLTDGIVFGVRYYNRFDSKPLPNTRGADSGVITSVGFRFGKR